MRSLREIVSAFGSLKRPRKVGPDATKVLKSALLGAALGAVWGAWTWLSTPMPRSLIDGRPEIGKYLGILFAIIVVAGAMGAMLLLSAQQLALRLIRPESTYAKSALLFMRDLLRGAAIVTVIELVVALGIVSLLAVLKVGNLEPKSLLFYAVSLTLVAPFSPVSWFAGLCVAYWKLLRREDIEAPPISQADRDATHQQAKAILLESLKTGALSAAAVFFVAAVSVGNINDYGIGYLLIVATSQFLVPAFFFGALGPLSSSYFDAGRTWRVLRYGFPIYGALTPMMLRILT